jgi:hypothetical protein
MAMQLSENIIKGLKDGTLQGVVARVAPFERPLQGLSGRLDWELLGFLSNALKSGWITGKAGEITYVPHRNANGKTWHFVFVGGAKNDEVNGKELREFLNQFSHLKFGALKQEFNTLKGDSNLWIETGG